MLRPSSLSTTGKPMTRAPLGRVARAAVAILGAAAAALAAMPAHAAEPDGYFSFRTAYPFNLGAKGSPGKSFPGVITARNAINPKLTFNLSKSAAIADAVFPAGCTVDATTVTCP